LKSLTGVRRKRLYEGLWVTAEGAVYDMFDSQTHVITRPDKEFVRWYLAMDEGYTNPAVILLVGEDNDGRWHIAKEWYKTGKLQEQVIREAEAMGGRDNVDLVAVDAAAAGLIAALINEGFAASPAKGRVLDGIWHIQDRLKIQDDKKPRLTVDPECLNTINEFESYIWEEGKDKPKKANDHAMDAIRYLDDIVGTPIWL
jgi:phage terminase large subunit